jgi:hypothetical protein
MTSEQRGRRRGGGQRPRRRVELAVEILAERGNTIDVSVRACVWQGNQTVHDVPVQLYHRDTTHGRLSPSDENGRVVWEIQNLPKADRHWFEAHVSFEYGDGEDVVSPRVYIEGGDRPPSVKPTGMLVRQEAFPGAGNARHKLLVRVLMEDERLVPDEWVIFQDLTDLSLVEVKTDEGGTAEYRVSASRSGGMMQEIRVALRDYDVPEWRVHLFPDGTGVAYEEKDY